MPGRGERQNRVAGQIRCASSDRRGRNRTRGRSTPAVADGKICTLGVAGVLSCLDANTGKVVWRKDSKAWPQFFTAASPIIVDGMCVAYTGGQGKGQFAAYDLAGGDEKWAWTGAGPGYGSPVLTTMFGIKQLVTPTENSVVGIAALDGKLLWQAPFAAKMNTGTPVVDGQTVIFSGEGSGTVALKVDKNGDAFSAQEIWRKKESSGRFNSPALKDGLLYGLTPSNKGSNLFCMNAQTGGDVLLDGHKKDAGNAEPFSRCRAQSSWL